nr:hypothetical protein [Nonomuraea sp. SYSU D8015]
MVGLLLGHAVGLPERLADVGLEPGALVEQRPAEVDVVEEHVRRRLEPGVRDRVDQPDLVAAEVGLDAADQTQVLGEYRGLAHLALGPQHAAVTFPPLAVASRSRRDAVDPDLARPSSRASALVSVAAAPFVAT